jgi:hypothetical protein
MRNNNKQNKIETDCNWFCLFLVFLFLFFSTNKIHDSEMQDDRSDKKIDKGAFGRNAELIGRIDLNAQAHGQHKAAHGRDESAQKCVEWKRADQCAIYELNNAC